MELFAVEALPASPVFSVMGVVTLMLIELETFDLCMLLPRMCFSQLGQRVNRVGLWRAGRCAGIGIYGWWGAVI